MKHRTTRAKGKESYAKYILATALNLTLGLAFVTYTFLNNSTYFVA